MTSPAPLVLTVLLACSICLISSPAYAYLDSGSGSIMIQLLFGGIAGFLAIIRLYWDKAKRLFTRCFFWRKKPQLTEHPKAKDHHDQSS